MAELPGSGLPGSGTPEPVPPPEPMPTPLVTDPVPTSPPQGPVIGPIETAGVELVRAPDPGPTPSQTSIALPVAPPGVPDLDPLVVPLPLNWYPQDVPPGLTAEEEWEARRPKFITLDGPLGVFDMTDPLNPINPEAEPLFPNAVNPASYAGAEIITVDPTVNPVASVPPDTMEEFLADYSYARPGPRPVTELPPEEFPPEEPPPEEPPPEMPPLVSPTPHQA